MSGSALFVAVFLACVVEAVEALTIILAAGTARDWRSAILGLRGGLVFLVLIVTPRRSGGLHKQIGQTLAVLTYRAVAAGR